MSEKTSPESTTYFQTIQRWRDQREKDLMRPDDWLAVNGLFFLNEGDNSVGASADCDVALPEGSAPDRVGVFTLRDGRVTFAAAEGAHVMWEGARVSTMLMRTDQDGEVDRIAVNDLLMSVIVRGQPAIRMWDANSPNRRAFKGLRWFDIDERWRVVGRFVRFAQPKTLKIATVIDEYFEDSQSEGAVEFEFDGATHSLVTESRSHGKKLFVNFFDATNGRDTYGGGRFLYTDAANAEGEVVLDFNRAFNPPCTFTPYATCPIPPRENRLSIGVAAGERYPSAGLDAH